MVKYGLNSSFQRGLSIECWNDNTNQGSFSGGLIEYFLKGTTLISCFFYLTSHDYCSLFLLKSVLRKKVGTSGIDDPFSSCVSWDSKIGLGAWTLFFSSSSGADSSWGRTISSSVFSLPTSTSSSSLNAVSCTCA